MKEKTVYETELKGWAMMVFIIATILNYSKLVSSYFMLSLIVGCVLLGVRVTKTKLIKQR